MDGTGMKLSSKLLAMTVATVAAFLVLFAILLVNERTQLIADRKEKLRTVVECAYSQLAFYERQVTSGKMSREHAQDLAKEALRVTRYNDKEYFWLNDHRPYSVMHPVKPELEGKDMSANVDASGKLLYKEFVKVVERDGAGFIDYVWLPPGGGGSLPKLAYVRGFAPWGWIIGTGILIDDVDARFRASAIHLLAWGVGIGGFLAVALALLSRHIIAILGGDPLYAREITRRIAAGDLSSEVVFQRRHVRSLLAGIKDMQDTLRATIGSILDTAKQVSAAADALLQASEGSTQRAGVHRDAATAIAASVQEVATSIELVKKNAGDAYSLSVESGRLAEDGAVVVGRTAAEMHKISEAVQSSSSIVEELGQRSDRINSIVATIREIAEQTNLLALNAAIEAARAGEHGRGFAVVADEVRKLAERTRLSTTEIADVVDKIDAGIQQVVGSMQTSVSEVADGVLLAGDVRGAIQGIRDGAQRVCQVVNEIHTSIDEQSMASGEIAARIEDVARMLEEDEGATRETAGAARRLQELSTSLHDAVARFRIDHG